LSFTSGGSGEPIENSPPETHTIPSRAGPGGGVVLSTVGRKDEPFTSVAGLGGIDRKRVAANPSAAMTATVDSTIPILTLTDVPARAGG
jgi:hypothetical protein